MARYSRIPCGQFFFLFILPICNTFFSILAAFAYTINVSPYGASEYVSLVKLANMRVLHLWLICEKFEWAPLDPECQSFLVFWFFFLLPTVSFWFPSNSSDQIKIWIFNVLFLLIELWIFFNLEFWGRCRAYFFGG